MGSAAKNDEGSQKIKIKIPPEQNAERFFSFLLGDVHYNTAHVGIVCSALA